MRQEHYDSIGYARMIEALNMVHYATEVEFYGQAFLRPCEEALASRVISTDKILDVGCGAGRVTRSLTARGIHITGVDVNASAIEHGKKVMPSARFAVGSMTALPVSDGSFTKVWCLRFSFNALPTEDQRLGALREFWRACQPGGEILVELFNWYYLGGFGLVRVGNILDSISRRLKWYGQGRSGSLPLPTRDILYLANKARGAAPGYAHLTTFSEMKRLLRLTNVDSFARLATELELIDGTPRSVLRSIGKYSFWLVLKKPMLNSHLS